MAQSTPIFYFDQAFIEPAAAPQIWAVFPYNVQPNVILPAGTVVGQVTSASASDVQTISVTGTPTGGNFVLSVVGNGINGSITIPYNCSHTTAQPLFDAVFGAGNTVITGGALPGTALVCTFAGSYLYGPMPLMTVTANNLSGGTTPAAAVAHTTTGVHQYVIAAYNSGNSDGSQVAIGVLQVDVYSDLAGNITYGNAGGTQTPGTGLTANVVVRGFVRTEQLSGLDSTAVTDLGRLISGGTSGPGVLSIY